jgi:RNA methyltransferase, TrmH family
MIKQITSATNPLIKHVVQLHSAKYRKTHQEFIAEGFRTIATLVENSSLLITLLVVEEYLYDAQQIAPDEHIIIVPTGVMDKISTANSPSGFLAVFKIPAQPMLNTMSAGVVLAQIADPGNMGTLIRTAAAMGKTTVVCIETVDPYNPKVVQASAGALGAVCLFNISWAELLKAKKSIPLYALVASKGKRPDEVNLKNALIVIGNEGAGIPEVWIEQCDEKITLPMPGNFESLNAAVAGSIALYLAQ